MPRLWNLKAWCEKEGFENISGSQATGIVAQVADGLQAAHEAGVIIGMEAVQYLGSVVSGQ